jgi:NhaP-type Na+/H+ or K+/H+ antiporter
MGATYLGDFLPSTSLGEQPDGIGYERYSRRCEESVLTELYVSLAVVGGLLLLLGMLGGVLKERTPISEPLVALLTGVLIGPVAFGLLDLAGLGDQTVILEEAALYYAAFSLRETGIEEVWVVGSLIICGSVLVHGVTATPLTKLYEKLPRG